MKYVVFFAFGDVIVICE